MLDRYLKQTAQLKTTTGENDSYGQPLYNDPVTIKARVERRVRYVRDATGQQVISNTTVITSHSVSPKDLVDDTAVISVLDMVNKRGKVIGYEVLL